MDQLFRIKNLQEKLTAFDVLLALEKHTKLKGLAVEIEKISASSCEPHIIGRIGDEDCDITPMLISALTNVCQVFDGWHQDGTVWSKFDEECRQEISKILKICDRRSVR